ncbi:DUF418 domain-containing protein [Sphingomonas parva]|uniref:DUF418 domain-containing protein n=1 Tax=Sphingomonas parva TaxID=2555898 RepID=A0A4Y8ZPN5_9SPHN|nr:DUF418 domain-containing protein [Sphingomonas parva]TFI57924.1 DUF418 domain-containing protein [Sphingomonas parva]
MSSDAFARIRTLDVLRGVAVLGILTMNIVEFALPPQAYDNPAAYGSPSAADYAAWAASFVLFDGKMRGLFSFLFGGSMLLVIERADARGEPSAAIHYRRMLWLGVIGLAHFYLIWRGDILFEYAVAGAAAWFFHQMEVRQLIRFGLAFLLVDLLLQAMSSAGYFAAAAAATAPGAPTEMVKQAWILENSYGRPDPNILAETLALYRGSYGDIVGYRWHVQGSDPIDGILLFGWEAIGYMLLGMAALRSGFLAGTWPDRAYRRVAAWSLGLTIAVQAGFAAWLLETHFPPALVFGLVEAASQIVRPPMVVGWAALIILLTRGGGGALGERLAAAGRAAFSNYLGTSIVMTGLFYGYGLGLYGHLGRAQLWLIVLSAWAVMLLWSKPWLDRFAYGPFEWVWRSLARGALQPLRRPRRTTAA